MKKTIKLTLLFTCMVSSILWSCKKDKKVAVPTLTTDPITNITHTSATGGGTIIDNGGADIIASGICWAKTNLSPTISDDTAKTSITSGSFTAQLKYVYGPPYYPYCVRAWASNAAGVGYGEVIMFIIPNTAPEARNIIVTGNATVGTQLTAAYTYFDAENDVESGTIFQWYVANDSIGAALTAINGATTNKYTITDAEKTKFITLGITPKSLSGTPSEIETKSFWIGPIE
ncbi:MAG: hypothetical protein J7497_09180 [Chitinophagaceae bacterium]|nr:hypothetical protein [Chitinophagaceae bacterium]